MILRGYELEERTNDLGGKNHLLTPGRWSLVETSEGVYQVIAVGLSYLAATTWVGLAEDARRDFIEDNQQTCSSCKARWIILDDLPALFCPRCKEPTK